MAATPQQIASLFLADIGAPQTPDNIRAVTIWLAAENSNPTLRNNPWNLHSSGGLPGQTGSVYVNENDQNVAVFSTIEAGVAANANNLIRNSATYPQYKVALDALRASNPVGFLDAIARSPWAASGYGLRIQQKVQTGIHTDGRPAFSTRWVPNPNGVNRLLDTWFGGTSGSAGPMGPTGPTTPTASSNPVADWWARVVGTDTNHIISQADYDKAKAYFISVNPASEFNDNADATKMGTVFDSAFKTYIGKPISSLDARLFGGSLTLGNMVGDPLGNVGAKVGTATSTLGIGSVQDAVVFLGIILVGIVFIGSGAIITLKRQAA